MLGLKRTQLNVLGKGTEQAFGHLGFTRSLGWADRAMQTSVGSLTSSKITSRRYEAALLRRFQDTLREAQR